MDGADDVEIVYNFYYVDDVDDLKNVDDDDNFDFVEADHLIIL